MKKKIYIDIDGVLLDYKTGQAAPHAEELIMFLTSGRYDCYWLTTHCKGDPATAISYLSKHFSGKVMRRLKKIKVTNWSTLKTEAIEWDCDFIWLEDYPFQAEVSELYNHHKEKALYKVDLTRKEELLDVIEFISKQGKRPVMARLVNKFWIILIIIAGLLAAFYSMPRGKTLFRRIIDRPSDYKKTVTLHADRGKIFDYQGNVIATNNTVYDLHMDCCVVEDQKEWEEKSRRLAQEIALILPERTAPEWWDHFQNARKKRRRYIPIVKGADYSMIGSLSSLPLFNEGKYKGGKIVTARTVREYPSGTLARRTIGGWNAGNQAYMFGLEKQFDTDLSGEDGSRVLKVGYRRGSKRQWEIAHKDKIDGRDIHTTLDMRKQAIADSILRAVIENNDDIAGGCLALMEVKTGAVVTLANIHKLENGTIGEYYDYMTGHSYEPGGVAQTMILAAALSDGVIKSLDERFPTNHGRLHDSSAIYDDNIRYYERNKRTDSISVIEGFSKPYRYIPSILATAYEKSQEYFHEWYKSFCVGKHDFDLPLREMNNGNLSEENVSTLISIGNGYGFTICPMQILTFYNTIANNGIQMRPMLIKKMESEKFGSQSIMPKELNGSVLRKAVTDSLKRALTFCMENGTAQILKDMPQQIIGKTGTSRQLLDPSLGDGAKDPYKDIKGRSQHASTFAGFYPADAPRYSVICVMFSHLTDKHFSSSLSTQSVKQFIEEIEDIR